MCPSCGTTLRAGGRFCDGYGQPVSGSTTASPVRDLRAYTPRHLAEKILTTRAALEGERKQVTVLFVDVSGFTSLSERLDPEDVHAFMTRVFELMLAEVHRYEGTVNQFLGDGIMTLFGASGAVTRKGKAEPRDAWVVRSAHLARTRFELDTERGLTPLVGRERKLDVLQDTFERAGAGQGQVVFIVGEPGIGKPRLLYEFHR